MLAYSNKAAKENRHPLSSKGRKTLIRSKLYLNDRIALPLKAMAISANTSDCGSVPYMSDQDLTRDDTKDSGHFRIFDIDDPDPEYRCLPDEQHQC